MKKLLNLLCLAACVFCMTACSAEKEKSYDETQYKEAIEADLSLLSEVTDEQIQMAIIQNGSAMSETDIALFTKWMEIRPEVGEYVGVTDWTFKSNSYSVTVIADVDYSIRDMEYEVCYLNDGGTESAIMRVKYTFAEQWNQGLEKLPTALLNTVIGMGVVFVVLYLMSLIIDSMRIIGKIEQMIKNKKESKAEVAAEAVDNTIAQIAEREESVELVDDVELVAVISAAIAASTGTSTDGFIVRSIRKSNRNKWRNA